MNTHAIDFFYQHAGHVLRPYMSPVSASPDDVCDVCLRPSALWLIPDLKVIHTQNATHETQCLSCRTLFEGNYELFGIGGYRGKNKDIPVTMKLGMAEVHGMLVTPNQATLFLPGNVVEKDKEAVRFLYAEKPPFEMVVLGSGDRVRSVLSNPPSEPFLFIRTFGKTTHSLVSNMKLSDQDTLYICSEKELAAVDIKSYQILSSCVHDLPNKVLKTFKSMMAAIAKGHLCPDSEELSAFLRTHPELRDVISELPQDPWLRVDTLKWLGI